MGFMKKKEILTQKSLYTKKITGDMNANYVITKESVEKLHEEQILNGDNNNENVTEIVSIYIYIK